MILLRCDADAEIGTGHFFRLLSLAEYAVGQGHEVELLMDDPPGGLLEQAECLGVTCSPVPVERGSTADAAHLRRLARHRGAEAIVVDGYHFGPAFYETISGENWRVAAVDDKADHPFPVDVLVNVNIDAEQLTYETRPDTIRLLGVDYTLMRRQFRDRRREIETAGGPAVPERVDEVLVFMGGADATNETMKVLEGLDRVDYHGRIDVVIGPSNPHGAEIRHQGDSLEADVFYHENVSDMAELIAGHHLSINAGGGTSWEMACLGVPMVQMVVAANQAEIVEGLASRGISTSLGWRGEVDAGAIARVLDKLAGDRGRRRTMSRRAMDLIDGAGVGRVFGTLVAEDGASATEVEQEHLTLRPATEADREFVWKTNNHPSVRRQSIHTDPIPWEGHRAWYDESLQSETRLIWVGEYEGERCGVVRVDVEPEDGTAEISVALQPEYRGAGLGRQLIARASERVVEHDQADRVWALIRPDNEPSIRAFEAAGYVYVDTTTREDVTLKRFAYE